MSEKIENRGRNRNRHTGSGLAGVRPGSVELGPVDHSVKTVEGHTVNSRSYSVLDQISTQRRMVIAAGNVGAVNRAKNNWTGR